MTYTIQPIDDQSAWEWFVLQKCPQALFQSWMWGQVQERMGVSLHRYGVYEGEQLRGVFQTVYIRARRGSFLHIRHGPIVPIENIDMWQVVFSFLREEGLRLGCWFIRISPLIDVDKAAMHWAKTFHLKSAAIHRMDGEQCWVLDLSPDTEQLLSAMRKTTRYEIRRAEKEGVKVIKTTDPKYLSEFFHLYEVTSVRQNFVPHTGIEEEFQIFAKKQQAMLYIGKHDHKTIAAAIILYYGNQAIYHHGASIPSHIPASSLIQWQAICDAKNRGMSLYNFWGIAPENSPKHPWRGITLFKKGFGGREIQYMHAQDLAISPLYVIPRLVETSRRILRGYD